VLHRAAYAALGLDWTYDAIEMTPGELPAFLASCAAPEWVGLSLTMPLKTDVLPLLDRVSDLARLVDAVNTVVFDGDGAYGDNTDVTGMRRALEERAGHALQVTSGTIVGSGATARSALAALASMGAADVDVVARNPERAREMIGLGERLGVRVHPRPWPSELRGDAVISTVPPGAADALVHVVPDQPGALLDVAYGHGPTALAGAWASSGGPVADGLDLLLWQAVDQVRLMTGRTPPVSAMRTALDASGD
jgi:shikimate dehydrogenase